MSTEHQKFRERGDKEREKDLNQVSQSQERIFVYSRVAHEGGKTRGKWDSLDLPLTVDPIEYSLDDYRGIDAKNIVNELSRFQFFHVSTDTGYGISHFLIPGIEKEFKKQYGEPILVSELNIDGWSSDHPSQYILERLESKDYGGIVFDEWRSFIYRKTEEANKLLDYFVKNIDQDFKIIFLFCSKNSKEGQGYLEQLREIWGDSLGVYELKPKLFNIKQAAEYMRTESVSGFIDFENPERMRQILERICYKLILRHVPLHHRVLRDILSVSAVSFFTKDVLGRQKYEYKDFLMTDNVDEIAEKFIDYIFGKHNQIQVLNYLGDTHNRHPVKWINPKKSMWRYEGHEEGYEEAEPEKGEFLELQQE